ncbi:hypothetical protein AALP_AAs61459U000100 [Arabis alpina]|uniref:FBD domain-containing protein n=1 Tax=Arabis alpina TaxID=50452 RepID=A0A087G2P1_ARAAL|nr:hypothetical protein AALP_AAs61459U000100 [Arabis alpina]
MPKLVKAEIKIKREDYEKLMGCLTSAKHLSLCLTSPRRLSKYLISAVPVLMAKPGELFCQLEYLELCTKCSLDWLSLLLMQSPKLRVLRLTQGVCGMNGNFEIQWEQPCCVPECLVSSVETVEWIGYKATKAEKEVAIYILDKANHLKEMTLSQKIAN